MLLTTAPFTVSSTTYIRRIMKRWLSRYAFIFAVTLAAFIILGAMVNPAFFIVALIFIFIVMPTAMMFVYYYYGLAPRTVMLSAGEVTAALHEDKVDFEIYRDDALCHSFSIPIATVREITPGKVVDTIIYGTHPGDLVLIDKNAFADRTSRIRFHNYIFDNIQKNCVNSRP